MKFKKWVAGIVLLVLSVSAYGQQYDPESDFIVEIIEGNLLVITGYRGSKQAIRIPSRIQGLPVLAVGDYAFMEKNLSSVVIPDTVIIIGMAAFAFNNLTSIIIPNSVTGINDAAFAVNRLTSITIPGSVKTIGDFAFTQNRLTNIIISNGVVTIGDDAFGSGFDLDDPATFRSNILNISSIVIPDSVTHIGWRAFFAMDYSISIDRITIGANVQVENGAFGARGFETFYREQGRRAGVYTFNNNRWTVQFR